VFDELKIKYKNLPLWQRLIICVLVGLLPGAYLYYEQAAVIEEEFATAEVAEKSAAQKLLDVVKKLKNLEQTERELAFTTEQLKKAETRLPTDIAVDEILRQLGKSAKDSSVTIVNFQPEAEVVKGNEYKYIEMPMKITVEAHEYSQLCSWLDTVAGLKARLYLKSWNMTRLAGQDDQPTNSTAGASGSALDEVARAELEARRPRELLRLKLDANLSVYRIAGVGSSKVTTLSPSGEPVMNGGG
jgi:Tfp pilus assembly protein PilO